MNPQPRPSLLKGRKKNNIYIFNTGKRFQIKAKRFAKHTAILSSLRFLLATTKWLGQQNKQQFSLVNFAGLL